MSTSPTAQDIDTMDNNNLRELLKEQSARLKAQADQLALLEKAKADADLALLAEATTSFSPLPATNLSNSLTAVAAMNEQRVSAICTSMLSALEARLTATILHAQHGNSGPSVAPTAASTSFLQTRTGLPGGFSPPSLQSSRSLSASVSTLAVGNTNATTTVQNEYDKAVEVDQCKLRDPDLRPVAIRNWKTTYDIQYTRTIRRGA